MKGGGNSMSNKGGGGMGEGSGEFTKMVQMRASKRQDITTMI